MIRIHNFLILVFLFTFLPGFTGAQELGNAIDRIASLENGIAALSEELANKQTSLDHMWTMTAAALVLMMQAGFLFLEAGMCRSKNSISVAQKNIADFVVAIGLFYAIGFGLMFGIGNGWFGTSHFFMNEQGDWDYTFFVFQAVFCGTAATIVSGAVAERMTFHGYLIGATVIAILIYPVYGHWAWGNLLVGDNTSWLADNGFIDFAGSTVVHSVGGWVALAGIIVIGPRIGKFGSNGEPQALNGHSAVLATFGAIILWVGWIGFNGGSTTSGSPDFARIVFNTMLAGAFGGLASMVIGRRIDGLFRPDRPINGILGGLVGITAGCDAVSPFGAVLVGLTSGVVVVASQEFIERKLKLDDVVGAVSVHGVCGAWGTVLAGALAMESKLAAASRLEQVWVQIEGVLVGFAWAFGLAYAAFKLIDRVWKLRVSHEDEILGLNTAEHGTTLGTGALQTAMASLASGEADLNKRLDETTGDEAAELAIVFNKIMSKLQGIVVSVSGEAERLVKASLDLKMASENLENGASLVDDKASHARTTTMDVNQAVAGVGEVLDHLSETSLSANNRAFGAKENVTTVIGNLDQMVSAISEIAQSVQRASAVAQRAETTTSSANTEGARLKTSTDDIRDFLSSINEVAQKSRVLSLNALIEAERAGEAGRGFAVVAADVKSMAALTEQISKNADAKLRDIEASTSSLLDVLSDVSELISEIGRSSVTVGTAVEEQSIVADDIRNQTSAAGEAVALMAQSAHDVADEARRASNLANGARNDTNTVTSEIAVVSDAISANHDEVSRVSASSRQVADIAASLQALMSTLTHAQPAQMARA